MNEISHFPIIIIGMHRSGTSMITRMLEEMGLFMGAKKDKYNEARFFFHINEWLFRECNATWDNPLLLKQFLNVKEPRSYSGDYIRFLMKSPYIILFLGLGKFLRYRNLENLDIPWGWKDPRNTYTLPLWLDIFPNAKVIHIYRHGVDVAQSLKARHEENLKRLVKVKNPKKLFYWYMWIRRRRHLWLTIRCASLEGGISLWEEYLRQARVHVGDLKERAIEIKYEDFLAEPIEILKSLSHFCELPVTESVIKKMAGRVKRSRAYAYMSNPTLQQFAEQISDRLRVFDY
jgi:hypothetical protein